MSRGWNRARAVPRRDDRRTRRAPARGGDRFRVFTPYWNRWRAPPLRSSRAAATAHRAAAWCSAAARLRSPPESARARRGGLRPTLPSAGSRGGRGAARRLAPPRARALRRADHDDLAADGTSRLSPYLHFGCLSPGRGGGAARWSRGRRGVHPPALLARLPPPGDRRIPRHRREDYRPRGDAWDDDAGVASAWKAGPHRLSDGRRRHAAAHAARAGCTTGRGSSPPRSSVKDVRLDWRLGAAHFFERLVDGDIANNAGNWPWVAGTAMTRDPIASSTPCGKSSASIRAASTSSAGCPSSRRCPMPAFTSRGNSARPSGADSTTRPP